MKNNNPISNFYLMKSIKFTLFTILSLCWAMQGFAQNPASAKINYDAGQLSKAKEAIDKALENPKHAEKAKTWLYKGMIYSAIVNDQTGIYKKMDDGSFAATAYAAYEKALQIEPDNKDAKKEMLPQGNLYGALANSALFYYNKAQKLTEGGKKDEAITQYSEVIKNAELAGKLNPKDTLPPYFCWAAASLSKNYPVFEKASEALIAHPDTKDKSMYCYYLASYYYTEKKDAEKAIAIAQKGLKLGDNDELQKFMLGMLEKSGNADEAINAIKESLKKNPNDAGAYFNMGVLYERVKKFDDAIAAYEKSVSIDNNEDALYNLGAIYYNKGAEIVTTVNNMPMDEYNKKGKTEEARASAELKKALPYFEKLYLAKPKEAKTLDVLGQIYQQLKMKEKAEQIKKERDALGD